MAALLAAVAAPEPHEGVGEGLIEDLAVAVAGCFAEDEAVVVAFSGEGGGGALAGHDPIVMPLLGRLGTDIVFRAMGEDAQGLWLAVFDELHAGVEFPGSEGILRFFRGVIILLVHEGAGVAYSAVLEIE